MLKRSLYLMPALVLGVSVLALTACDDSDKAAENAAPAATESAVTDPAAIGQPLPETAPVIAPPVISQGAQAYATADGARTGAVFVSINNPSPDAERLLGASSDKAATVEIHESVVDEADGTMQMRKVDGIDLAAGQTIELKPGGYHIMLIDLSAPLVEGETFNVTLQFEKFGAMTVPVSVVAPGAAASATDGTAATHDDHQHGAEAVTTPTDEPLPDTPMTPTEEVPADESVTEAPATDEQPAQ